MICALTLLGAEIEAQTITVLHNFTNRVDGGTPYAGLTRGRAGNFYGTTVHGGAAGGFGVVFRLSVAGSGWILTPLYSFQGGQNDGAYPQGGVVIGPDGSLYGTTNSGGQHGQGTVYRLRPSPNACTSAMCVAWQETVLYSFCSQTQNCTDGAAPGYGNLVFDQFGNLYGTTVSGGAYGAGVVFKLEPSSVGWTENVLYSFPGSCLSGCAPFSGVIFDSGGNLYGTTILGGEANNGVVYELSPSGSGWTEQTLASVYIAGDSFTVGGVAMDGGGNLFGTTGGSLPGGVFELTPCNGTWTFNVLYAFSGGGGPYDTPTLDAVGNVYGTSSTTGLYGDGEVFKLTPSNEGWVYTSVSFDGSNGYSPFGSVVLDGDGNLYGTTSSGGAYGYGVVFKIVP
jgi:uncharacterized repeat protein (TIGR03803 family)